MARIRDPAGASDGREVNIEVCFFLKGLPCGLVDGPITVSLEHDHRLREDPIKHRFGTNCGLPESVRQRCRLDQMRLKGLAVTRQPHDLELPGCLDDSPQHVATMCGHKGSDLWGRTKSSNETPQAVRLGRMEAHF